ncbi:MAG: hypothetical protein Q7S84_03790 [bacterium]|nr:hypothetical protein [bacterium]
MTIGWGTLHDQFVEATATPEGSLEWRHFQRSCAHLERLGILTSAKANAWGFRFGTTEMSEGLNGYYFVERVDAVAFGNAHFPDGRFWEPAFFGELFFTVASGDRTSFPAGR